MVSHNSLVTVGSVGAKRLCLTHQCDSLDAVAPGYMCLYLYSVHTTSTELTVLPDQLAGG